MVNKKLIQKLEQCFSDKAVDAVYLFGSQATGKATRLSDCDVAVLFDKSLGQEKRFKLQLKIIGEVCQVLKTDKVDIVDLAEAPIALQFSAISPRKEIIVKNKSRKVLFEAEVMSKYFDYVYYIKQNTKYSLNSIAGMA